MYPYCHTPLFFSEDNLKERLKAGSTEILEQHPISPCPAAHLVQCEINALSEQCLTHSTKFYRFCFIAYSCHAAIFELQLL